MRPPDTAPQESCVGCVVARRRMSKPTLGGGRIGRATIVGFIALQHLLLRADASNWAQTTGPQQQNNVIPRIPNPDVLGSQSGDYPGKNDHWSRRQGQALVIVPANTSAGRVASAFILGGDSYVRDSDFTELSGQFMNDVWYTEGVQWFTGWEAEKKNEYGAPLQKSYARMSWNAVTRGYLPPVGVGYDEWIQCQARFERRDAAKCADPTTAPGYYVGTNMWSPRRNLGAAHLRGVLYVMGGRARDLTPLAKDRMVGGVVGGELAEDAFYSNRREPAVLLNDVWKSVDYGATWTLVTAGCKAPQEDLLLRGNLREGKWGSEATQCLSNADCFGAEVCNTTMGACVCPMWSPREQHAVTSDGRYLYVMGGLTAPQKRYCGAYACGDPWAGAYTGFMNDVWRSEDGRTWELLTPQAAWEGRGGHQVAPYMLGGQVYLAGGRTGELASSTSTRFLNDVWRANLTDMSSWGRVGPSTSNPWAGRAGHIFALQPPLAQNDFIPSLVVVGGEDARGVMQDTWVMHLYDGPHGYEWAEDYSPQQWFRQGSGSTFEYRVGSPQQYYINAQSPVERVVRHYLPKKFEDPREGIIKPYLTEEQVHMLHSVGIMTVSDMADADQRTILKLRGWDYPQVPLKERLTFHSVCDFRALCKALIHKCTHLDETLVDFDGENRLPRNVVPKFQKGWPTVQHAQWYGVDYTSMNPSLQAARKAAASSIKNVDTLIKEWDGCEALPPSVPKRPNVPGLGPVSQVESVRDPSKELNELHCRTNPLSRAYMTGGFFQDRLWLFGGRRGKDDLWQDSWYRDEHIPFAYLTTTPKSKSATSIFRAKSDKEGVHFEYKVYMIDLFTDVRGWTKSSNKIDVSFLNKRKGGPGSGNYILYVRAVDPAGNRDHMFVEGRNMYTWYYKNPLNWTLLLGGGGAAFALLVIMYIEYRRRMKKRAMERYALKRMRRKFKGMQKDMEGGKKRTGWRDLRKDKGGADKDKKADKKAVGKGATSAASTKKDAKKDVKKDAKKDVKKDDKKKAGKDDKKGGGKVDKKAASKDAAKKKTPVKDDKKKKK